MISDLFDRIKIRIYIISTDLDLWICIYQAVDQATISWLAVLLQTRTFAAQPCCLFLDQTIETEGALRQEE